MRNFHALHPRSFVSTTIFAGTLLSVLTLGGCNQSSEPTAERQPDAHTTKRVEQGKVIGFTTASGAHAWLGLPFAAPPVGERRWRAPRAAQPWTGTRTALEQPSWCPQLSGPLDKLYGLESGQIMGSEDCLYLNIYAPDNTSDSTSLPVMVWVHGGSNSWGRAEQFDASILAQKYQVVVVVVQYRLGPLGWFSHPALRESATTPMDASANFALLDIMAALRWVKKNIANFGGDSSNLTLFGESAGASNVMALLASPKAKGLFQKAIVQSGIPSSVSIDEAEQGNQRHPKGAIPVMSELFAKQPPTAKQLRNLSVEQLFRVYGNDKHLVHLPTLIEDGIVLPEQSLFESFATVVNEATIPIILGSNRDEPKFVYAFHPDFSHRLFNIFPRPNDPELYAALNHYISLGWRAAGIDKHVAALSDQGAAQTYTYRFDWDDESHFYFTDFSQMLGAAHSIEIPFVFGDFDGFLGKLSGLIFTKDNKNSRLALSEAMMSYWTQFAYTGSPGNGRQGTLPHWPSIGKSNKHTMLLDQPHQEGIRSAHEATTSTDIISSLLKDNKLDHNPWRCTVAERLNYHFGSRFPEYSEMMSRVCTDNKAKETEGQR